MDALDVNKILAKARAVMRDDSHLGSSVSKALPSTVVSVEGVQRRMFLDTGCLRSIAKVSCCKAW